MHHYSFSIIIVTWNAVHHLKKFLPTVAATEYENVEIIIADNASKDGSVEWIKENYPKIKIVSFDKNHGYAGGNNKAVKYATGDVLIFLNNDVQTEPNWLNGLNKAFQDEEISIAQPKILSEKQPGYFEYAGAAGGYIDWLGYPFCRGRIFDTIEEDEGQYNEMKEIFWASGAAFAIRKDLFVESGGFDEDFEFHMEEIDLCWRCQQKDKKIVAVPDSVVYHLGGGSLPKSSPRKVFYNYRNSLLMLMKNLNSFVFMKIFFRLVLDGISGIRLLFQGKPAETIAIIRSHFAFYAMIPDTLKKRKDADHQIISKELMFDRLIIVEYFLRGKKYFSDL
ncbi:MAG: glycosyltransferase family 2 protein [Balneolaceae bacterium]|nr:glycosyltransferase family 2 protein [Balneolaceae bacterium]